MLIHEIQVLNIDRDFQKNIEQVSKIRHVKNHTFENMQFFCVCIFEPQIYILSFNKLVSYKVLIGYMNLQVGFSGSDVEQRLELEL